LQRLMVKLYQILVATLLVALIGACSSGGGGSDKKDKPPQPPPVVEEEVIYDVEPPQSNNYQETEEPEFDGELRNEIFGVGSAMVELSPDEYHSTDDAVRGVTQLVGSFRLSSDEYHSTDDTIIISSTNNINTTGGSIANE